MMPYPRQIPTTENFTKGNINLNFDNISLHRNSGEFISIPR